MKTVIMPSAWTILCLAACGGSATTEPEPLSAPTATVDAPAARATQADCTPVDACDPDKPLFCAAGDACFLLYPNQRTVPVSCIARPASPRGSSNRRCP